MSYAFSPQARAARRRLPGALPGLRPGGQHPGPDLRQPGARLARRAGGPARLSLAHLGAQPRQRHPRPRRRGAAGGRARERAALPALLPHEGGLAGPRPAPPLRPLRAARHLGPQDRLRRRRALGAGDLRRTSIPRFATLADRVFAENHLDSEIRKGKRGGAFCFTVLPALHALGAGQLRRPGARCGHPRPRARPRHPQHAGRAAIRSSPSTPRCRWPRPPRCSARC